MTHHPHIVQITTHDTGRHVGCYGHPTLVTPEIDALAADGVRLSNYFAAVPICCASRATMLTGRYPQSNGLMDLCFSPFDWRLNDDEQHLSHILKQAGYTTVLFGVQHEVHPDELDRLAFDRCEMQQRLEGSRSDCLHVAEAAAEYLKRRDGAGPLYAQIGFFETHTPFTFGGVEADEERGVEVPPYLADSEAARRQMALFQGAVRKVDRAVGMIRDALRETGMEQNTLLVFTTDHGIEMPRAKWHLYDPGIGIACVMRFPAANVCGGRVCDALLSNVDYLPTVLQLAGVPVPAAVQGRDFADLLCGRPTGAGREAVYAMYHKTNARAVRTERFKFIRHFDAAGDYSVPVHMENLLAKRPGRDVELYDLERDPNEFRNVADEEIFASTRAELDAKLWAWLEEVDDPILKGSVASPAWRRSIADYHAWKKT